MNHIKCLLQMIVYGTICCLLAACSAGTAGQAPGSQAKAVAPQPGAAVNAVIDTADKAISGALSFTVSASGAALEQLRINLKDANCNNIITMGSVTDFQSNPGIAITDGVFSGSLPAMGGMVENYTFNPAGALPTPVDDPMTVGTIEGRFTSPTAASGTIHIYFGALMTGGIVCDLGTFNWSAE